MGEACYYLKGDNCSEEAFENIKLLFIEGSEAEYWWQDHRKMENEGKRNEFWSEFEMKFPMIAKYLKFANLFGNDCNNDLAGKIDFGSEEDVEDAMYLTDDGEIGYSAMVWHFAEWDHISDFLESEFGLKNVRWINEEDANMFDLL